MSNPNIQQVRTPSNPSLKDALDLLKRDIFLSLNCHHIATIQSFDPVTQTASATINYKKTFFEKQANGQYSPVQKDYPILLDCPVVVMRGGTCALTMPIAAGDTCLVLFNDRDLDNWFQSGQIGPVASPRAHSFSDGLILVGVAHSGNPVEDYDTDKAVLKNGSTRVGVGASKVEISNGTTNLNTLLQDLITQLKALIIDVNAVAPGGGVVSAASQAQLTTIANQISGLLE